jgi:hypothetical protein
MKYGICCAALLLLARPVQVDQQENAVTFQLGWLKVQDFIDMSESQRLLYTTGFLNGILVYPLVVAWKERGNPIEDRLNEGMTNAQITALLMNYFKEHPHQPLNGLSAEALAKSLRLKVKGE